MKRSIGPAGTASPGSQPPAARRRPSTSDRRPRNLARIPHPLSLVFTSLSRPAPSAHARCRAGGLRRPSSPISAGRRPRAAGRRRDAAISGCGAVPENSAGKITRLSGRSETGLPQSSGDRSTPAAAPTRNDRCRPNPAPGRLNERSPNRTFTAAGEHHLALRLVIRRLSALPQLTFHSFARREQLAVRRRFDKQESARGASPIEAERGYKL